MDCESDGVLDRQRYRGGCLNMTPSEGQTNKPLVEIIVVSWNRYPDLSECLDSLERLTYSNYHITVVDNGSTDGTPQRILEQYPGVCLLRTGENIGFSAGNNVAIRRVLSSLDTVDYILLLNDDTVVEPGFLDSMIKSVAEDPSVGMAAPLIYYHDSPEKIWWAATRLNLKSGWKLGWHFVPPMRLDRPYDVEVVPGCAMLVRREVVEQVGLLNESLFMYWEDVEYCIKAKELGYRLLCIPTARIWHRVKTLPSSSAQLYYCVRNLVWLVDNRASSTSFLHRWFRRTVILGTYSAVILIRHSNIPHMSLTDKFRVLWRAWLDGCKGRIGIGSW